MKATRGSTLIETMVAGTVLILGLVGVAQLMISGVTQFSRASSSASAQSVGAAAVAELKAVPFDAVTVGVQDAGIVFLDNRRFGRIRTVTDMVVDGGIRARRVVVVTDWVENLGTVNVSRTATSIGVVSEVPDANF